MIVDEYTRESGVRGLERNLARIARKSAYSIVNGDAKSLTINEKRLREFLGPRRVYSEVAARTAKPGVATGLAYTQVGGEILFIEANDMPGGKRFTVTGSLGEVMKESARTALSLVRSSARELGIEDSYFGKNDIHLHVPAGAVPKDGPSAGVAMTTAIASLALGKPVRNDVAMTGEITLTGLVLPIGGVKEKILAARRAGIQEIILPKKNQSDVEEIERDLLKGLRFTYVEEAREALEAAMGL
jgi:ATP-dependent Lon protease